MNRMIRTRLSGIAVLLVVPLIPMGCLTCEDCTTFCDDLCYDVPPFPGLLICNMPCMFVMCWSTCASVYQSEESQVCLENPEECAAMSEYYQAAARFCEAYPEECQEYFDAWVESMEEAEE